MFFRMRASAVSSLLLTSIVTAKNPFSRNQIQHLFTFGDSYTVQNVGDGRLQWQDWLAGYAGVQLTDFAQSGATCSQALTPRIFPAVTEDELPLYLQMQKNGTVRSPSASTLFTIWIGTNDVGAGCLLTGDQTKGVTLVDTTACVVDWARTLYNKVGARNFLFMNMVPLHRIPMYEKDAYPTRYWLAAKNATEWNASMQQLVASGNALSRFMLRDLSQELPNAHLGIFDSHSLFSDMLDRPQLYLNGTAPFNTTGCANPCVYPVDGDGPPVCTLVNSTDVDSYVWYNELHASNQANRVVARQVASVIRGEDNKWTSWL